MCLNDRGKFFFFLPFPSLSFSLPFPFLFSSFPSLFPSLFFLSFLFLPFPFISFPFPSPPLLPSPLLSLFLVAPYEYSCYNKSVIPKLIVIWFLFTSPKLWFIIVSEDRHTHKNSFTILNIFKDLKIAFTGPLKFFMLKVEDPLIL